jgi:hypothetical protein
MDLSKLDEALKAVDAKIQERINKMSDIGSSLLSSGEELDRITAGLAGSTSEQQAALKSLQEKLESDIKKITDEAKGIQHEIEKKISNTLDPTERKKLETSLQDITRNLNTAIIQKSNKIHQVINDSIKSGSFKADELVNELKSDALSGAKSDLSKLSSEANQQNKTDLKKLWDEVTSGNLGSSGSALLLSVVLQYKGIFKRLGIDTSSLGSATSTVLLAPISNVLGILKNIPEIMQGYILQLKSAINMFVGIGQGIISIPLRIMEYAADVGHRVKKENIALFNQLEKLQDSFQKSSVAGQGMNQMGRQLQGRRLAYLNPNTDAARLYGATEDELIERQIEETSSIIKAMGTRAELMTKAVTSNVTAANSAVANYYYKAKKLMNLSEDDIGKLTNMAISLGKSFPDVFDEISQATSGVAKQFSLDFKMMSADVLTLRKDIVNFGHKSADELALVAGHIRQMGVSMSDAMSVFNKFNTFEDAATTAAQLSQTFGMVVDSMELLKAQSPDEVLQQYKDAFIASGKSFETMDRFSKSLILQQTGLSDQAAQALFSAENAGKTYEEIMAEVESNDPTERQARNMEEMKDAIVELKQTLSQDFKSFFEAMQEGFTKKLFNNPTIRAAMERMAKAMDNIFLKFTQIDISKLEPFIQRMVSYVDRLTSWLIDPKTIDKLMGIAQSLFDIVDGFSLGGVEGQKKMQAGFEKLYENIQPIFKFLADFGMEVLRNIGVAIVEALPGIIGSINFLLDNITTMLSTENPFKSITDTLFNQETSDRLSSAFQRIFDQLFGPKDGSDKKNGLIGRLDALFEVLFGGINGQGGLSDKMMNAFKSKIEALSKDEKTLGHLSSIGETMVNGLIAALKNNKDLNETFKGLFKSAASGAKDAAVDGLKDMASSALDVITPEWLSSGESKEKAAVKTEKATNIAPAPVVVNPPVATTPAPTAVIDNNAASSIASNLSNNILSDLNAGKLQQIMMNAVVSGINAVNSQNPNAQQMQVAINLDGKEMGKALLKNGFTGFMTDPNITGNNPTINPTALSYSNGSNVASRFQQ